MIFDINGLPKDIGATDYMDSCRLSGLMAMFDHPKAPDMRKYLINGEGVRYPFSDSTNPASNNPKNFTRDQLMCLASGLHRQGHLIEVAVLLKAAQNRKNRAQNIEADVPGSLKKFPDGADVLSPSNMNHLRICSGQKSTVLGKLWLMADIVFNSWFSPNREQNQLMAMCQSAGPFYVKMLRKMNKNLDSAIISYWGGWRQELDFGKFLIEKFR